MKNIIRVTALAALLGATFAASPAFALTRGDINGEPVAGMAPDQDVQLDGEKHYVNVEFGEVVQFDRGGQSFEWKFDGLGNVVKLSEIAPQGIKTSDVTVYVNQTFNPLNVGSDSGE